MAEQIAYNIDCMEYMKSMPDKYFDLAVVDPPYGGGANTAIDDPRGHFAGGHAEKYGYGVTDASTHTHTHTQLAPLISAARIGGKWATAYQVNNKGGIFEKDIRHWDIAPPPEYFDELARVSKNQIIWGGNYFDLPPTRCFLIWRKLTISENFTMAMAEYAWTSFNSNAKVFEAAPQGNSKEKRFHPTQKPVALYEWIYKHYTKEGDKILDTHLGSGSSRIAAYEYGLDFVGCEIDKTYFDLQEQRWQDYTAQGRLF